MLKRRLLAYRRRGGAVPEFFVQLETAAPSDLFYHKKIFISDRTGLFRRKNSHTILATVASYFAHPKQLLQNEGELP